MRILFTILVGLFSFQAIGQVYGLPNSTKRYFTSSGDAILRIQPDQVVLSLGVESRSKDLLVAKKDNYKRLSASIKYCKDNGIPDKFIQTDYIQINPHYNYNNDINVEYYSVSQSFSIIIEDIEKYEEFLTSLLELGINKVKNIEFRTSQLKEHRQRVRKMAIAAAKEKAEFLTNEIGIELDKTVNIKESTRNPVNSFGNRNYANNVQNVVRYNSEDMDGSSLAVGMLSLRSEVTLTFEVKD